MDHYSEHFQWSASGDEKRNRFPTNEVRLQTQMYGGHVLSIRKNPLALHEPIFVPGYRWLNFLYNT